MKQEIEEFRSQNGNINYTTKDLLHGLNTKVDRINLKLEGIAVNKTELNNLKALCFLAIVTIGGVIAWIVSKIG